MGITHTPGPWKAKPARNARGDIFYNYWHVMARNVRVADLFGEIVGEIDEETGDDLHLTEHEITANARLIAAAPDLLEVALLFKSELDLAMVMSGPMAKKIIDLTAQVDAAIAKAKGDAT